MAFFRLRASILDLGLVLVDWASVLACVLPGTICQDEPRTSNLESQREEKEYIAKQTNI